jgi:hypothetical protein
MGLEDWRRSKFSLSTEQGYGGHVEWGMHASSWIHRVTTSPAECLAIGDLARVPSTRIRNPDIGHKLDIAISIVWD